MCFIAVSGKIREVEKTTAMIDCHQFRRIRDRMSGRNTVSSEVRMTKAGHLSPAPHQRHNRTVENTVPS